MGATSATAVACFEHDDVRVSYEVGAKLGRQVARFVATHARRPVKDISAGTALP